MLFAFLLPALPDLPIKADPQQPLLRAERGITGHDGSIFLCCLAREAALCPVNLGDIRPAQLFQVVECLTRLCACLRDELMGWPGSPVIRVALPSLI